MAENKKSFVLYADLLKSIEHLTNEEKGILFTHLLEYVNDKNPVLTDRLILTAWKPIELQLKRDLVKFEQVKAKRSEAGKRSAESRALKSAEQEQTNSTSVESVEHCLTNSTDNVNVNDNENVNVNDNVNVINDIQLSAPGKKIENFDEIPTLDEFINFANEKLYQIGKRNVEDFRAEIILKYEAWKENGWKTGGEKSRKIKNWKSTLNNTIGYFKGEKSENKSLSPIEANLELYQKMQQNKL